MVKYSDLPNGREVISTCFFSNEWTWLSTWSFWGFHGLPIQVLLPKENQRRGLLRDLKRCCCERRRCWLDLLPGSLFVCDVGVELFVEKSLTSRVLRKQCVRPFGEVALPWLSLGTRIWICELMTTWDPRYLCSLKPPANLIRLLRRSRNELHLCLGDTLSDALCRTSRTLAIVFGWECLVAYETTYNKDSSGEVAKISWWCVLTTSSLHISVMSGQDISTVSVAANWHVRKEFEDSEDNIYSGHIFREACLWHQFVSVVPFNL